MRSIAIGFLAILLSWTASGRIDEPTSDPAATRFKAVLNDFEQARKTFAIRLDEAKTEQEREALRSQFPMPEQYYEPLLELAEKYPNASASVDALVWIAATSTNGYDAFKERGPRIKRAMDLLIRDHLGDPRVGRLCLSLVAGAAPHRDAFLAKVYKESTDRRVKGRAGLALAEFLLKKSETVAELNGPSAADTLRRIREQAPHRMPYLEKIRNEDPKALVRQGERLLETTIADYGDLDYDPSLQPAGDKTLADVARTDLRRLHSLAVGQTAPEIDGTDALGKRFKLSDYRGKVVLLTFSGNWCGPCRAMYPAERAIVARLKGRPFALLSVNTDESRETLRKSVADGEITWRCWWESGTEGPICTAWMIQGFPEVFLLDHKGVIRQQDIRQQQALDRAVDLLLQECETESKATP